MYRRILLSVGALLLAGAASAWKIEGRIAGVKDTDSVWVQISRFRHNIGFSFDTDTIRGGRFSFSGLLPAGELTKMMIRASSGQLVMGLWITDTTRLAIEGTADGKWRTVSNEPEQAIEQEIQAVDLSDLNALIRDRAGYEKYRDSVWRASVERLWPLFARHPNSSAVLNHLTSYVRLGAVSKERLQWFYDRLSPENRATLEGEAIAVAIDPPHVPQVGEPFADFEAADTAGVTRKLSDYAGRGDKYVLLDLWSVGCGGCYAAFPELKKLYAQYHDRLEIIGISLDADQDLWLGTLRWQALPWKQFSDGKGTYAGAGALYRILVMPTYILIDPQGKIVERWYPGQGDFQTRMIGPYLDKQ